MESSRGSVTRKYEHERRSECVRSGWQSGFFFTRPSVATADALDERARRGTFTAFVRPSSATRAAALAASPWSCDVGV
jgi:hypothetical protein